MTQATPTTQIESPTTRVTRWDFPPGSSTGHHTHQFDYIVVPVTDGVITVTGTDGSAVEAPLSVGGSYARSGGISHNVANLTSEFISFVEIELLEHPTIATD